MDYTWYYFMMTQINIKEDWAPAMHIKMSKNGFKLLFYPQI